MGCAENDVEKVACINRYQQLLPRTISVSVIVLKLIGTKIWVVPKSSLVDRSEKLPNLIPRVMDTNLEHMESIYENLDWRLRDDLQRANWKKTFDVIEK